MKRVAIIPPGVFPVPPTKGGAVENLIQNLIEENEEYKKMSLNIFSIGESKAIKISKNFKETNFYFIKIPKMINILDLVIYFLFAKLLRKEKPMSYRYIAQRIYFIIKVAEYLHQQNFDRVILENHATLYLCLKFFGNYKKYKNKYAYHMHNKLSGFYGCEEIIENTPLVIGVSKYVISEFKKYVPNYSTRTKFVVLRNKVSSNFAPQNKQDDNFIINFKKNRNIPLNNKIVLFSGRLNEEKGIDKLLSAWNEVKLRDATLLIVGAYYFNSKVRNSTFDTKLNNLLSKSRNVIFTGFIDYNLMPRLYEMADIAVLPSMWEDPAPLTVIEALTSGCPLITTNSGGIPEYASGVALILNKEDSDLVSNLAKEILELLTDSEQRALMHEKELSRTKDWSIKKYYSDFCKCLFYKNK